MASRGSGRRGAVADAVAQDALEVRGVVRVHELAGARQVQVVEPRQPEAQRGGAQQRRPLRALVRRQRPHRVVGADERGDELGDERAGVRALAMHQSLTVIARS